MRFWDRLGLSLRFEYDAELLANAKRHAANPWHAVASQLVLVSVHLLIMMKFQLEQVHYVLLTYVMGLLHLFPIMVTTKTVMWNRIS